MIIVRNVFQAKYGKGDELLALFKEARRTWASQVPMRLLTDLSGPFFTVVAEFSAGSLAEWERVQAQEFARPEFGEMFARTLSLTESGRREYYTVEE
jgi:hypothetical protein